MPKNRIIITFGVLIALLPLFGFPRLWESFFQIVVGVSIVLISVWSNIDKHLTLKAKAQRRQAHKKRVAEIEASKTSESLIQEEHY